ncbi:hypothetical protein QBC43DRAFT_332982 [Cladorrhinum sp. PSN259]|nr:hypothetical protein QBC43DRAFT_332982 [Cladorrhinum sp. PSN259]
MWIVNERNSTSASSAGPLPSPSSQSHSSSSPSRSSTPFSASPPPVVSYHLYSTSQELGYEHHHHQQEFCQSSGTMEGSYNYTEVEMIESSRVRVVRSQLSQIKSAVTSRLSPGWWIGSALMTKPSSPPPESTEVCTSAITTSSDGQPLSAGIQRRMHIQDGMSPRVREIPTRSRSHSRPPIPDRPVRSGSSGRDSGVDWRFGGHGMSMIFNAESKNLIPELERSNYISGVRDMLRGLPSDLTPAEASWILSQNMPKTLSERTAPHSSHPYLLPSSHHPSPYHHNPYLLPPPPEQKNLVHQLALPVLEAARAFILWIGPIVWGYIRYACEEFVRLEKEHHWGERVVWPLILWGLNWLVGVVLWLGNAFPGQMVFEVLEYVKQGLLGALSDFMVEVGKRERMKKDEGMNMAGGKGIDVAAGIGLLSGLGQMGMGMAQQQKAQKV